MPIPACASSTPGSLPIIATSTSSLKNATLKRTSSSLSAWAVTILCGSGRTVSRAVVSRRLPAADAAGQCLTVKKDPVTTVDQPHTTLKDLHTSPCDEDDPYQMFDLYDGPEVIGGQ